MGVHQLGLSLFRPRASHEEITDEFKFNTNVNLNLEINLRQHLTMAKITP